MRMRHYRTLLMTVMSLLTASSLALSQEKVIGYVSSNPPSVGDDVFLGAPVLDEFDEPMFDDDDNIIREPGFFAQHYPDYELRYLGQCEHPDGLSCLDLGIDADDGLYSLFFIAESVSSARADGLIETSVPVIINEQWAYDNWGLTGDNTNHGSPGTENDNGLLDGGSHIGSEVEIVDEAHPIAVGAGLSNGVVSIYDPDGAIVWGTTAPSADVVATIPGFEDEAPAAAIFVYDEGDTLANGEEAFGMRIGGFLSDIATGSTMEKEATLLTDEGLALMKSVVDFALGIEPSPPEPPACEPGQGDFDGNGRVEFADFLILSSSFGQAAGPEQGDVDCNGQVEFADFLVLSANFGQDVAAAAVPEPSGLPLLGFGLMALAAMRNRRR